MPSRPRTPSVRGQFFTCALLCAVAVAIVLIGHTEPKVATFTVGLPLWQQAVVAASIAAGMAIAASIALANPRIRNKIRVPSQIQRIDLSASKPLQIGLAAGLGEELLFRAALQPLLGLWWASIIFTLAHIRTAALADGATKKIAYLANVMPAGVALGLIYQHLGLLAAILIHAAIDVAFLTVLQLLKKDQPT